MELEAKHHCLDSITREPRSTGSTFVTLAQCLPDISCLQTGSLGNCGDQVGRQCLPIQWPLSMSYSSPGRIVLDKPVWAESYRPLGVPDDVWTPFSVLFPPWFPTSRWFAGSERTTGGIWSGTSSRTGLHLPNSSGNIILFSGHEHYIIGHNIPVVNQYKDLVSLKAS